MGPGMFDDVGKALWMFAAMVLVAGIAIGAVGLKLIAWLGSHVHVAFS